MRTGPRRTTPPSSRPTARRCVYEPTPSGGGRCANREAPFGPGWLKTGANASKVINIEVGDPGKRIHERGEVHRGRTSEKWSTARSPSPRRRTSHGIASTADALSKPSGTLGKALPWGLEGAKVPQTLLEAARQSHSLRARRGLPPARATQSWASASLLHAEALSCSSDSQNSPRYRRRDIWRRRRHTLLLDPL